MLLEVIVTNVEEALEAQEGGADRLELLAAPEHAGLTPSVDVVGEVLQAVAIPVRVMLRDRPSMSLANAAELAKLQDSAAEFSRLPIDGIVTGFIRNGVIDEQAMRDITTAVPATPITFHRAFDSVHDKLRALEVLKGFQQVDRLLTSADARDWPRRLAAVSELQRAAAPRIRIILAAGKDAAEIGDLLRLDPSIEVHVGRAARDPQTLSGALSRSRVAALKRELVRGSIAAMRD